MFKEATLIEDNFIDISQMRKLDFFLSCMKCRHKWPRSGFDFKKATFIDPKFCRCCNNDWTIGFTIPGKAPSLEKGDPQAWDPLTDEIFISKKEWLDFQVQQRESTGNPLLPVEHSVFLANKEHYIKLRDDFLARLKDQQIDEYVVFKMLS